MSHRHAVLAATAGLTLIAGPVAASADAASAPAAAKRSALAFQHALGKGQTARACALLTPAAVKLVAQQAQKPASTSCAAALPAYRKIVTTSFGVSASKLQRATSRSASANGPGWLVTTSAATTGVTRSRGAWKVSTPIALG